MVPRNSKQQKIDDDIPKGHVMFATVQVLWSTVLVPLVIQLRYEARKLLLD